MQPKNASVIRPLLFATQDELEKAAQALGLPFHDDESNLNRHFLRNRLRHDLLPLLAKDYQPGIVALLARTAETLAEEQTHHTRTLWPLISSEKEALTFSRKAFRELKKTEKVGFSAPALGRDAPASPAQKRFARDGKSPYRRVKAKNRKVAFFGLLLEQKGDKVRLLKT